MSTNLQQIIQEKVRTLSEDEMRKVLNFVQTLHEEKNLEQAKPISKIFEELSSAVPLEEWQELPADGALNHNHYLYGAPKKAE